MAYGRFGGWPAVLDQRSDADLRSIPDRLLVRLFSSSVRVSTPLRRSFPERRSRPLRLSSIVMGRSSASSIMQQNDERDTKLYFRLRPRRDHDAQ